MSQFVHLRLHTEYSLLDGIVRVPELMAAVAQARMPAIALTDQSNLFAMVKFYKEAQAAGVKDSRSAGFRQIESDRKFDRHARFTSLAALANVTSVPKKAWRCLFRRVDKEKLAADRTWSISSSSR